MPITKLALQRRNIVRLNYIKEYIDKWADVWHLNRQRMKIGSIEPYADPKMWNVFLIKCNVLDDALIATIEGEGFTVADIKFDWSESDSRRFIIRVIQTSDPPEHSNIKQQVESKQYTEYISKLLEEQKK